MRRFLILLIIVATATSIYAQLPKVDVTFRKQESIRKEKIAKLHLANEDQITENQEMYDVKYYFLDLIPDPTTSTLYGHVKIDVKSLSDQLNHIELNFYNAMHVNAIYLSDTQRDLIYYKNGDLLIIELDKTYLTDELISISIDYHGKPQNSRYHSFGFGQYDGKPMIWTLSEPYGARAWWPCKDVPSDKPDSVGIRVTVPKNLIVASNGILREEIEVEEKKIYTWHESYPIATYLVSLAIHPYKVYYDNYLYNDNSDTMKIHFYMFEDNYTRYKDINSKVKHMIRCFADMYGEYPFVKEKYGQADFLGGGAMEHQTCSSFAFWGEIVYAHELAHQWWGDLITCDDFQHIWLNEGFATYSEALYYEFIYGPGAASYYQMINNLYLGDGTIFVEDPYTESIFHGGLSYRKASWVLHMLRHIVGDSTFFDILKTYYNHPDFRYSSAKTADFKNICEDVSGLNLDNFFQQWIYEEHYPEYSYYWLHEKLDDETYRVYGVVNQLQTKGPVFDMPVDLTIKTAVHDTVVVLHSDESCVEFEYIVEHEPYDVVLDEGNWILKTVQKIQKPDLVVLGSYINDEEQNDNRKAEPGETVKLYLEIKNKGLNVCDLDLKLTTSCPSITIVDDNLEIEEIKIGETVNTSYQPFTFSVSHNAVSELVPFSLEIRGNNSYKKILEFYVPVGYPQILFVDDDEGKDNDQIVCEYLNSSKVLYDKWNIGEYGYPGDLATYTTMVWATGEARDNTLDPEEQRIIMQFLDSGGNLFISGQNIGYDLVENGDTDDSLFYYEYLGANYIGDTADDPWIIGDNTNEIGKGLYVFLTGNYGSDYKQNSTDIIAPGADANSFLVYSMIKECAGIYHELPNGAKVVYIPFGMEGIAGPNPTSASVFISRVMDWLKSDSTSTGLPENECVDLTPSFRLYDNFPNPFNPETNIQYRIPKEASVSLTVYNILGEKIITLIDEIKPAGIHTVRWDGKNYNANPVQSGIYIYKLNYLDRTETRKMLIIK